MHRLSELKELIIHIDNPLHPEHIANVITYDIKRTLLDVLHDKRLKFQFTLVAELRLMGERVFQI